MNKRLAEIKLAILEDKKKAGVLAALTLVALVVGARAAFKVAPKRAGAATTAQAPTQYANSNPNVAPGSPAQPITIPAIDPAKLVQSMRRYAVSASLTRDPFALDPVEFPTAHAPKSGSAPSEDQAGAALPPDSEASRAAEILKRMRVRSLIIGPRPVAVIEIRDASAAASRTVAIGDDLEGFTVSDITANAVTLTLDGATHTLTFEKPRK